MFIELTESRTAGKKVTLNTDAIVYFNTAVGDETCTFIQLRDNSSLFVDESYTTIKHKVNPVKHEGD